MTNTESAFPAWSRGLSQRVAAEIRAELARRRISGRELAMRLDEPPSTVARWLRGETPMALDELERVCDVILVAPEVIVGNASRAVNSG